MSMAEQNKKRPRLPENAESSASKKTSVVEVTCPVATIAPAPARASPSPVATRTPSLALPSPVSKRTPSMAAPSPVAKSKPIAVVKPAAATVAVTNPVPATASAAVATSPVATSTPALAEPSPAATTAPAALPVPKPNTVTTRTPGTAASSPVATAKPTATVKHEPEEGGAIGSHEQAAVVPAAEEAIISEVEKKRLHCVTCHAPLKPPISMCDGGHAVCCGCAGGGGENKHCGGCNRDATYTRVPCMDALVGAHKVPCPYKNFGCGRSTVYYAAADHKARCAHAPCYCLECLFEGSPASLLRHLTDQSGRHRWPVEPIKYEIRHPFVVPASEHRSLLVAEDGCVFLLAVGAGRGASGVRPVNIVCVRGNAGGADARPLFTGVLWVDGPPATAGHLRGGFQLKGEVASCGVPGEVDMEHGQLHAHVNPEMLHGESKEVHLGIRITKLW